MSSTGRDHYLEHEILSAAPQKLQLLLIEAAIRQAKKAQHFWSQSQDTAARQALVRAQEIVAQMLAGIQPDQSQPLVRRVVAVYSFIIRALAKAYLQHDKLSLADALRVLEIERQTWQQVCQQLSNRQTASSAPPPHISHLPGRLSQEKTQGVSLEA
jgi:flagellar protein FliS